MYPAFYRPDPPPPQGPRFSATLPAEVFPNPPSRGPMAAAVLGAVLLWPGLGEPIPHVSLITKPQTVVQEGPPPGAEWVPRALPLTTELGWEAALTGVAQRAPQTLAWLHSDEPPPAERAFVFEVSDGIFYREWRWIPLRMPSGGAPTPPDAPLPHAQYQTDAQTASWVVDWLAQQVRQLTPPSGAPPVIEFVPASRQPPYIDASWREVEAIEFSLVAVPQLEPGDQPPPRVKRQEAIWSTWELAWAAQHAPLLIQARPGDPPQPYRRLADAILAAWVLDWPAQSAPTSAEWVPPPPVPGDEIPCGRILPAALLNAWQPPFVLPPRLAQLLQSALGDQPPVLVRLPASLLETWQIRWDAQSAPTSTEWAPEVTGEQPPIVRAYPWWSTTDAWEVSWRAQRAPFFLTEFSAPPLELKGIRATAFSDAYYRIYSVGGLYYLVRVA